MKFDFVQVASGAYELEFKANSDFNIHVEHEDSSKEVYIYYRGSSEGEYRLFKSLKDTVVDVDFNIPENLAPKFFKIKCFDNPTLCEISGDIRNITGSEVKPEGLALNDMVKLYDNSNGDSVINVSEKIANGESTIKFEALYEYGTVGFYPTGDIDLVYYYYDDSEGSDRTYSEKLGPFDNRSKDRYGLGAYMGGNINKIEVKNNLTGAEYSISRY